MEAKDTVRDEPLLQRPRHRAVGRVAFEEKPFRVAVFGEYVGGFLYAPDTEKSFSLVHLTFSRNIYREVKLVAGVDNLVFLGWRAGAFIEGPTPDGRLWEGQL